MLRDLALEARTATARTLFTDEAWRALGPKARRQLLSAALSRDTLRRCARRWHVEAACFLEYVTILKRTDNLTPRDGVGRALRRGSIAFSVGFGPKVPPEWRDELQRLNGLPLSLGTDLSARVAPSHVEEYRLKQLGDDEEALALVSANPLAETKEHFLRRADDHYQARALRLERVARVGGFTATPPRDWPELSKHVGWLIRYQLHRESFETIAQREGGLSKTVGKTVHDVAAAIGLSLRPMPRGRRPQVREGKALLAARSLRAVLQRTLQQARRDNSYDYLYLNEIKLLINEELPSLSPSEREMVLSRIKGSASKNPSTVASRIAALKFHLPLRQVRAGRLPGTKLRRPTRRFRGTLDDAERRAADSHRGHHPRRGV